MAGDAETRILRWVTLPDGRRVPIRVPRARPRPPGEGADAPRYFLASALAAAVASLEPAAVHHCATTINPVPLEAIAGASVGSYLADEDRIVLNVPAPLLADSGLEPRTSERMARVVADTFLHEAGHRLVEMTLRASAVRPELQQQGWRPEGGGLLASEDVKDLIRRAGRLGLRLPHARRMAELERQMGQEEDAPDLEELGGHTPAGRNEWFACLFAASHLRRIEPQRRLVEVLRRAGVVTPRRLPQRDVERLLEDVAQLAARASGLVDDLMPDICGPLEVSQGATPA